MEERTESYRLVTSAEDLAAIAKTLEGAEAIGVDLETTALSPRDGGVRLIQLATLDETFVIDVFEVPDLSLLKDVLEDGPVKVGHNVKFDYEFLHALYGISLSPLFDTMLAAQVLDGGNYAASYSLESVAERYLEASLDKSEQRSDWSGELSERQIEYAARDASILLPLRERLAEALEAEELGLVSKIEFAAVSSIAEMELAGIKLDVERWKELEKIVRERRDRAALELESHFPEPEGVLPLEGLGPRLNLNSPQQITDAFKSLGIELPDTKVWTLLKVEHPAAEALLRYRELQKKLGTYLETYPKFIHPKTGRIHANFLQCRVPTGRLACVAKGTFVEIARDQSKDFAGVPIERVEAGDLAYTYDENRRLTLRRVLWAGKTGREEVLSLKWRSGSHKREGVLEVTPDHEVRLSSGEYMRADRLRPGDRVMALGRDITGWGYSRIYATGYPGPMREHRVVFEAVNGYLPEHVHHVDENKLNNLPENLVGLTNPEHVGHHVNGRMDGAERSRLAEIARNSWVKDRDKRLRSLKRGEESGRWLDLDREWMEEVLWENAGKPTAFRDVHGIDYETACKYLKMHGIDWKAIAENFTTSGELIDESFYKATERRTSELGFNAGLKASGIGSRRWKKIKARFEGTPAASHNHEILSVERTGRYVDVYDLEIEDTHNFIAGEICVHNCTNPNIQQIPHEDEFRSCFVAEEGNTLVIADYSQIELRILAEVSEDPAFVGAFQRGEDLHRLTAATMYGVSMDEVTKDQRSAAKRINFGLMYGRGAKSLSAQLGTDEGRGRQLIDEYFANYPKVQRFLQRTANRATRDRTLRTLAGRVRKFGESPAMDDRGAMRREAMNYPIQGCVLGNTRVFEEEYGYQKIENLVGQEVRVWDGEKFVDAAVIPSGAKRLVKVTLSGGHTVECSPDHKFLTVNNLGNEEWVRAEDLRLERRVKLADAVGSWSTKRTLPQPIKPKVHNGRLVSLGDIADDTRLGEWIGRLASDGTLSDAQVTLLVAEHEEAILPRLLETTRMLGHVSQRTREAADSRKQRLHYLTVSSKSLATQLREMGVKNRIPQAVWSDDVLLASYLRGLFDGDGTVNQDNAVLVFGKGVAHEAWAREVQEALLLLDIQSRVRMYPGDRTVVQVLKRDMPKFSRTVGFLNPLKQRRAEEVEGTHPWKNNRGNIYGVAQKVKSVEVTDLLVPMYDVVNSASRRFAANGVVTHNTSADIAKLALAYVRRDLKSMDARLINSIHDEFVVECAEELAPEVPEKMKHAMVRAGEKLLKKVPVEVETVVSREWRK